MAIFWTNFRPEISNSFHWQRLHAKTNTKLVMMMMMILYGISYVLTTTMHIGLVHIHKDMQNTFPCLILKTYDEYA